jgi:hypothetical protein
MDVSDPEFRLIAANITWLPLAITPIRLELGLLYERCVINLCQQLGQQLISFIIYVCQVDG